MGCPRVTHRCRTPRVTEPAGAVTLPLKANATEAPMPLFHTHVVVDWSARSKPSPKRKSKDAIWWAVARIAGGVDVEEPAVRAHPARGAGPAWRADRQRAGCRPAGAGGFRLPLRLPEGCCGASYRQGVVPSRSGTGSRRKSRTGRTTGTTATRSRRRSTGISGRRRPVLGPSFQVGFPDDSGAGVLRARAGASPAGAAHLRRPCQGCQDGLAIGLCRLRRLADAAGPARPKTPEGRPAHREAARWCGPSRPACERPKHER